MKKSNTISRIWTQNECSLQSENKIYCLSVCILALLYHLSYFEVFNVQEVCSHITVRVYAVVLFLIKIIYIYFFFHPLVIIICNVDHNKIEYRLGIRMIPEYMVDMKAFSFILAKACCCLLAQSCLTAWAAARQASLSITTSRSLLKLISVESVMPSNHLIPWCPLLLLPSISPSIRIFSSESLLHRRWPNCWSFSLQHQSFQ